MDEAIGTSTARPSAGAPASDARSAGLLGILQQRLPVMAAVAAILCIVVGALEIRFNTDTQDFLRRWTDSDASEEMADLGDDLKVIDKLGILRILAVLGTAGAYVVVVRPTRTRKLRDAIPFLPFGLGVMAYSFGSILMSGADPAKFVPTTLRSHGDPQPITMAACLDAFSQLSDGVAVHGIASGFAVLAGLLVIMLFRRPRPKTR